jgi:hypothetical protein
LKTGGISLVTSIEKPSLVISSAAGIFFCSVTISPSSRDGMLFLRVDYWEASSTGGSRIISQDGRTGRTLCEPNEGDQLPLVQHLPDYM